MSGQTLIADIRPALFYQKKIVDFYVQNSKLVTNGVILLL